MSKKLLNSNKSPLSEFQALLKQLSKELDGEVLFDSVTRKLYATDASVYQELPTAVAFPRSDGDIQKLIEFAADRCVGLIPRTAGTSLAGQVVGSGIVVDLSRNFDRVLEVNRDEGWVRVQPGVIRDELNRELARYGLIFGPETSTSNRAMIGGMVGNNSCGANSVVYGTTRDQTLELRGFLSDGSEVVFKPTIEEEFEAKCELDNFEGLLYRGVLELLSVRETQQEILQQFPRPDVCRRNTGYAVDRLLDCSLFGGTNVPFNFCQLLTGSEGTLFFVTEVKLKLDPLPPPVCGLLCAHFDSLHEALQANVIATTHRIFASELLDRKIIEGALRNSLQRENLAFVQGAPEAILGVEFRGETTAQVIQQAEALQREIELQSWGYAFPLLLERDAAKVWSLRKAGLGVVANVESDFKPVTVIEDTAVAVVDLPAYIAEVEQLMNEKYQCQCVYYGHAASGEIHLRPVLNLKTNEGRQAFRGIAIDIAALVKRYGGSLSGEHGDGRLRSEFIGQMIGESNYQLLRSIKKLFDPDNIFNPGKIVDAPKMDQQLRVQVGQCEDLHETIFDFGDGRGLLSAAEMCSGSGDCRKTELTGGTMCPSYQVTRNEAESTRARANILRHVLARPVNPKQPLNSDEVNSVMDLCLSCKGCKSECPSNVDVARMKAEFLQAYYDVNGVPPQARRIAGISRVNRWGARFPWLANFLSDSIWTRRWFRSWLGFASQRRMPRFARRSLPKWFASHRVHPHAGRLGSVYFFCDEFTSYTEPEVGRAAIELLERLGWQVELIADLESGRAAISKGLLRDARGIAEQNVARLSHRVSGEMPLVSIEPSAILTFRDEYPDLLRGESQERARRLGENCLNLEEFVDLGISQGKISAQSFSDESRVIRLHGHCHQKALIGLAPTVRALQLPAGYRVRLIPSGCCGMAGSFGFESEHYELSMQIGELVLFPTVRGEPSEHLICATGTSCRHQIQDGTGRRSLHPAQILRDAYRDE